MIRGRSASVAAGVIIIAVIAAVIATAVVLGGGGGSPGPRTAAGRGTTGSFTGPSAGFAVGSAAGPAPPSHGAYFGARAKPTAYTQGATVAAVRGLQHQIGRKLSIVHVYLKWHESFRSPSDLAFLRQGSLLLVSWSGADTRAIADGTYDSWIRQQARAFRAAGSRIFLEWRWEMDRPGLSAQIHSPADYIAAWNHIRSVFARERADNVAWVWCPTARGFADGSAAAYYPGNSEVTWVCADAYPPPGPVRSFSDVVSPFLAWASRHAKPVIIGEYGVPQSYPPRVRAQWLWQAARTVQQNPQVKALVYFDGNAKRAYSLAPGSPALRAFRGISRESYFNPPVPRKRAP